MKRLLLLLVVAGGCFAAEPFRANDVVCYVGDSITHGGTYHSIVTLYYATRFPDRPIRFYNCGIGGDRASMIMSDERYRLNVNILGHKPTAATIMLGMNDVGHADYVEGQSGPEVEAKRKASLDTYRENMQKLIAALQGAGARLTLITPSIYEEAPRFATGDATKPRLGVNAALGECARYVRQFSEQYHTGLVDFWGGMNAVNAEQRKTDPLYSVVGPNRVHPDAVGHFVMAYLFLKAQNLPREVAVIGVDARKKKAVAPVNCRVDNIKAAKNKIEFDALENSLPLVVPEEARPALKAVPFMKDFDQEILAVHKLKKGSYELAIDGHAAGKYSNKDLDKGVNLAENTEAPQYQQAAGVTKINTDRTKLAQKMRDIVSQKYALSRAKFDVLDRDALIQRLRSQITAAKSAPRE